MHSAVEAMLARYRCESVEDHKNALREIIQEIALLGLFRAGFFDVAAFYGGTALRVLYGLPRFSEDIDFSLLQPDLNFSLGGYCEAIRHELLAYGFEVEVSCKEKNAATAIESAFIKGGTLIHLLKITSIKPPVAGVHADELLKVKLEVDTNPPPGAHYELKYLLAPLPFAVRVFTPGALFAGKLHAILCRGWKSGRVKGRDLYDYVWYLSRETAVDLSHLEQRMKQTGHLESEAGLDRDGLIGLLEGKFSEIDYQQARRDVLPFIKNPAELDLWSAEFFMAISRERLRED